MADIDVDLTPFGFTQTESLVYRVLLTDGPGTGYAVARAAGLARANAYGALEGLVTKGAARAEEGRPKRYRPESPPVLLAKLTARHTEALDKLRAEMDALAAPDSPTLVPVESARSAIRLLSHDLARATASIELVAPPDAFPLLAPTLRRAHASGVSLMLSSSGAATLPFAEVRSTIKGYRWPGMPLLAVVDDATAMVAARQGSEVNGYWGRAPAFVASARMSIERLRGS